MRTAANIYRLGVKELWSLWREPAMLVLVFYIFTVSVYASATALPETLHKAPIAIVDEDQSPLSARVAAAFYPPSFVRPVMIAPHQIDAVLDAGDYTFVLDIAPNFQRDVLAGKAPALQLNVDATRMSQAFSGSGYVQQIVLDEVAEFSRRYRATTTPRVELAMRARFNPGLNQAWFGSLMSVIDHITMLSILLTGAALIREREHGTIEHLLAMPVTPTEIMLAKVWSMGFVVLVAASASLLVVVQGTLQVVVQGSMTLFIACAALHLFATTSMGIFMATLARTMPQFALMMMLTMLPLQMLSGGASPRESMPALVQDLMLAAPTTHFVMASQAILYRGAGIDVIWPQCLAIATIGTVFFLVALDRFRRTIGQMA